MRSIIRIFVLGLLVFFLASVPVFSMQSQQARKPPSVAGLIYDLRHPDGDRRKEAAVLVGYNRIREAIPVLIELTQDADDLIRLEAVRALVRINDTRALPAYIRLTQDGKKEIQEKAIEGIINVYVVEEGGFIQGLKKFVDFVNPFSDDYNPLLVEPYIPVSEEAIQALARLLSSPENAIRKGAGTALGILRARSVLPAIQDSLGRETDNGVKVELIRALYKIADRSAGAAVVPLIRDPDRKVRDEAILTAGRLRVNEAVESLVEIYQSGIQDRRKILGVVPASRADDLQRRIFESLAYIGDSRSQELFQAAIAHEDAFYRRYGAEGLGRIGDHSVTTEVAAQHLREKSADVKLALGFALYRLGRDEHLVELVQSLKGGSQGYDYLLELMPNEVLKLYPYLRSEKDALKVRLLEIVGLRGDASAIPVVEELAGSENAEVMSAANLALRRLRARG